MGLFSFMDPTKPGKGVDKDAPKKHAFFMFWELLWRKFSRFIVLNMVYFLCLLPLIFAVYFMLNNVFSEWGLFDGMIEAAAAESEEAMIAIPGMIIMTIFLSLPWPVWVILIAVSAILYGPVTCGFTYVLRNYARQEHAWMSDFWAKAKANFKQGVMVGLLELLFIVLLVMNLSMTGAGALEGYSESVVITLTISRYLTLGLSIIVLFMHNYIYTMIVTFDLKLRQLIKNALIFTMVGLPRNILAAVIDLIWLLILFFTIGLVGGVVEFALLAFFMLSFCGFARMFITYPVIDRLMIQPVIAEQLTAEGEEEDVLELDSSDAE